MARTPTSNSSSPVFIVGILVIVLIGNVVTSGIENHWLALAIMVAIALVLSWPLRKILQAAERRSRQDHRH